MKNFSGITDNLDITTKKYVDDGLAGKANLAGNNTFTGGQTITGANGGYSINASGYVKGSWLQSSITDINGANGGHASNGTDRVCVFDGAGWIYYRTPAEILTEAGGAKASDIPPAVTESTVSGWGFTKNTGTVTDVKMNGTSKVTNGVADLGTVLTDAGGTLTGALSSESYYKAENAALRTSAILSHMAVNVANNRTNSHTAYMDGQINIKSTSSSSEKTITIPDKAGTLALTSDIPTIPDVSGKANLSGGNIFKGNQTFVVDDSNSTIETFVVNDSGSGLDVIKVTAGAGLELQDGFTTSGAIDCRQGASVGDSNEFLSLNYSDINRPVLTISDGAVLNLDGDTGQAGQVCTSSGNGTAPTWTTLPITSATLDAANKTLYLTLPSGS